MYFLTVLKQLFTNSYTYIFTVYSCKVNVNISGTHRLTLITDPGQDWIVITRTNETRLSPF